MKRIGEGAATEALERAGHRCGLTVLELGACARTARSELYDHRTPLHHINPKGRSGSPADVNLTENLIALCPHHHDEIHERGKPVLTDKKGRRYYQLWAEGKLRRHYFFEDVAEDMQVQALELDTRFQSDYRRETAARIDMSRTLALMGRFALFPFTNGEPEDANEYCGMLGIVSPSTVRAFLAAGTFLLDNPDEYERIVAYNEACETGKEFTYSMLRDGVGSLRRMDAHERAVAITDMMNLRAAGMAGSECVDAHRSLSPRGRTFTVTATLKATDAALTVEVAAADSSLAKQAFKRVVGISGALAGIVDVAEFRKVEEL